MNGGTSNSQQSPTPAGAERKERKPCDHVWEYCSGPDHAARWLCSRCEAEMIAPVQKPEAK